MHHFHSQIHLISFLSGATSNGVHQSGKSLKGVVVFVFFQSFILAPLRDNLDLCHWPLSAEISKLRKFHSGVSNRTAEHSSLSVLMSYTNIYGPVSSPRGQCSLIEMYTCFLCLAKKTIVAGDLKGDAVAPKEEGKKRAF